ncbi:DUF6248 family natural product biosynthesis protein [Streptacidiphilus jiangxiensis]|uniref:Uncharacterized protein n=1 Tax=Streptacidiphilus jiangxiensis TaxID=235985 RepID=A0A1H8B554_STRJI|nr:DUF6248 family natural product biosynthesis protein [Streptacidiphilus jiangxiensis]SEM77873.1 hypothetical protein SAMN05414137_15715 [Streptacidiphilus jiangxiensis]
MPVSPPDTPPPSQGQPDPGLRPRRRGPALSLLRGRPVTLLRLHAAAFLAIREPIPSSVPSPMTEAEAAWVRETAWTRHHRRIDGNYPHGFYRWCDCERGVCSNCVAGAHSTCATRAGARSTGPDSVTGPNGYSVPGALVIQADHQRPCSWICPCPCPTPEPTTGQEQRPTSRAAGKLRRTQAALFD